MTCARCWNGRRARRVAGSATVVTEVPVDEVAVGDLVVVGPGEVVPVDGWSRLAGGAGRVGADR